MTLPSIPNARIQSFSYFTSEPEERFAPDLALLASLVADGSSAACTGRQQLARSRQDRPATARPAYRRARPCFASSTADRAFANPAPGWRANGDRPHPSERRRSPRACGARAARHRLRRRGGPHPRRSHDRRGAVRLRIFGFGENPEHPRASPLQAPAAHDVGDPRDRGLDALRRRQQCRHAGDVSRHAAPRSTRPKCAALLSSA